MSADIIKVFKEKISSDLGKDIGVTLVSQIVIMILALIINKLLSIMLGVEGYGQYSIIKKSTSVLSFVMLSGMGIALPRYFSGFVTLKDFNRAKSSVIASILISLIVSLIVITICILSIDNLSPLIVGSADIKLYFAAIFFAISITTSSLLFAYYRGANSFKNFAVSQIAIQVIITICTIFFGNNLTFVLFIWSVATLIYVFISIIIESGKNKKYKETHITWNNTVFQQLKTLSKYGIPRLVGDFFLFSFAAFPLIFINQKIGIKPSSFFATGITLTSIITPFFAFTGMVLLPYVSKAKTQNNFTQADKLIKQLTIVYIILSAVAILVLWFGMDTFIRLFFSSEFLPSANISRIIILSILFESIYLLLRNPIDAISSFPYNTINLIISFIVLIVLFYFSKSLEQYAVSFLTVTAVKSSISFFTWQLCRNKNSVAAIV
jgi:O-antigen/teichoic acid export membrane protein